MLAVEAGLARVSGIGAVAQLGEHRLCKPGVAGSIPVRSTIRRERAAVLGMRIA